MDAFKLDHYRTILRAFAARVQDDAQAKEEQTSVPTGGQAAGGLSNVPMHLGDLGTEASIQEVSGVLFENERYLLDEALAALKRIDAGTYGICTGCGKPIAEARLEALPYTPLCVTCASHETVVPANINIGRPQIETETIAAKEKLIIRLESELERTQSADEVVEHRQPDIYAAGTPGGGTEVGGLGGTNIGRGNPTGSELETAMGTGNSDDSDDDRVPLAGRDGGAISGTPSSRRSRRPTRRHHQP